MSLPTNYSPFVIYSITTGKVLGLIWHESGDRAAFKAEDVVGEVCSYNTWKKATPAERKRANQLGEIT